MDDKSSIAPGVLFGVEKWGELCGREIGSLLALFCVLWVVYLEILFWCRGMLS